MQTEIALFCRNEASCLAQTVTSLSKEIISLPSAHRPVKLHLLENGSHDETPIIAKELAASASFTFEIQAHVHLPAGKSRTWNYFLSKAHSPHLFFMDADVRLSKYGLRLVLDELAENSAVDLVGATPGLPPDFYPENFWQSVFALPYDALPPAASLAGGAYGAKKSALKPMPEDVINEDLYLSLSHEGRYQLHPQASFFVIPPKSFGSFIAQRKRILQSDQHEQQRQPRKNIASHRRNGIQFLLPFLKKGGLTRTVAFLGARTFAQLATRIPPSNLNKEGWSPHRSDH